MASGLLELREASANKIEEVKNAKEAEIVSRRVAYEKCRETCVCVGDVCLAAGLYLCKSCNTYKKQKCGVANCKKLYSDQGCKDLPLPKKSKSKTVLSITAVAIGGCESEEEEADSDSSDDGASVFDIGSYV